MSKKSHREFGVPGNVILQKPWIFYIITLGPTLLFNSITSMRSTKIEEAITECSLSIYQKDL